MLNRSRFRTCPMMNWPTRRMKFIGFIFQFHFLMEDFTAQENVMIPMRKVGPII